MIPVFIVLSFGMARLVVEFSRHGERKHEHYNGPITLFAIIVMWALYYWAGLFDVFMEHGI